MELNFDLSDFLEVVSIQWKTSPQKETLSMIPLVNLVTEANVLATLGKIRIGTEKIYGLKNKQTKK